MKRLSNGAWTALTSLGSVGLAVVAAKTWGLAFYGERAGVLPANFGGVISGLSTRSQTELAYCIACLACLSLVASFAVARGHLRRIPSFVASALGAYIWAASSGWNSTGYSDTCWLYASGLLFVGLCWFCSTLALWVRDSQRFSLSTLAPVSALILGIYGGVATESSWGFKGLIYPNLGRQPVLESPTVPEGGTIVSFHSGLPTYVQQATKFRYIDQAGLEMKNLLWKWDRTGAAKLYASKPEIADPNFSLYASLKLAPGAVTQELLPVVTDGGRAKLTTQETARALNAALMRHHQPTMAIDTSLPTGRTRYSNLTSAIPTAAVTGTLLINGQPAAGVRLRLIDAHQPQSLDQAYRISRESEDRSFRPNSSWGLTMANSDCITDAQGRFRMDHLDSTTYLLQCRLEGSRSVQVTSAAPTIQLQHGQQFDAGTLQLDVH